MTLCIAQVLEDVLRSLNVDENHWPEITALVEEAYEVAPFFLSEHFILGLGMSARRPVTLGDGLVLSDPSDLLEGVLQNIAYGRTAELLACSPETVRDLVRGQDNKITMRVLRLVEELDRLVVKYEN